MHRVNPTGTGKIEIFQLFVPPRGRWLLGTSPSCWILFGSDLMGSWIDLGSLFDLGSWIDLYICTILYAVCVRFRDFPENHQSEYLWYGFESFDGFQLAINLSG